MSMRMPTDFSLHIWRPIGSISRLEMLQRTR
jgi:hypothetical protein